VCVEADNRPCARKVRGVPNRPDRVLFVDDDREPRPTVPTVGVGVEPRGFVEDTGRLSAVLVGVLEPESAPQSAGEVGRECMGVRRVDEPVPRRRRRTTE
jgi:hypothetical protein